MFGKQKQMGWWIAIAVAMGMVCASHVSAQKPIKPPPPPSATLVNLGPGRPLAMNQLDSVVEIVGRDGSGWAHYWMVDSTGVLVDSCGLLASLPGAASLLATDINNQGQIAGYQTDSDGIPTPLVWATPLSLPVTLPLAGNTGAYATSISDDGIVVGWAWDQETGYRSLMAWKIDVPETDIIVLDTQVIVSSTARIEEPSTANNGYVSYEEGYRAFRLVLAWDWDSLKLSEVEGSRTQLFTVSSEPYHVNDHGTVCGTYTASTTRRAAFAMTVAGDLLDLPTLPGGKVRGKTYVMENERAVAINHNNQLVGVASQYFPSGYTLGEWYDVIFNVGGEAVKLESLVSDWQNGSATDINDAGWVIGRTSSGAVVLIP